MLPRNFADKIFAITECGCWIWMGPIMPHGYGLANRTVAMGKGSRLAHRVSYEDKYGPIPEGLELDHLCRVRCCVNPDHLEPVTKIENIRRGESFLRNKTHCIHGHKFTKENTIVCKGHRRNCRECNRIRRRKWEKNNRTSINLRRRLRWAEARDEKI